MVVDEGVVIEEDGMAPCRSGWEIYVKAHESEYCGQWWSLNFRGQVCCRWKWSIQRRVGPWEVASLVWMAVL